MITTPTLPEIDAPMAERVAAGAQELDHLTPDWFEKVDVTMLNMGNSDTCILGQVYGDYYDSLGDLGLVSWVQDTGYVDAAKCGFTLPDLGDCKDRTSEWSELKDLWIAEIGKRKAHV